MPVLTSGLESGVAGEDAVDVAVLPLKELLYLLAVPVGRGLDQLLRHVAGDVRLEELLQQRRQSLCRKRRESKSCEHAAMNHETFAASIFFLPPLDAPGMDPSEATLVTAAGL